MTDQLYILFQQIAAAAWLALVAGVWFFRLQDSRPIDRHIGMACVLISPYLLTCYGVHSVNVAENLETRRQMQFARSEHDDRRVDDLDDRGPEILPVSFRGDYRELSPVGSAGRKNQAGSRRRISKQATDGSEISGSWWRSYGSDITVDINRRSDGVVGCINQTAEGIEPGREN